MAICATKIGLEMVGIYVVQKLEESLEWIWYGIRTQWVFLVLFCPSLAATSVCLGATQMEEERIRVKRIKVNLDDFLKEKKFVYIWTIRGKNLKKLHIFCITRKRTE